MNLGEYLTINDVCTELRIHRSTLAAWRKSGRGPRCLKLPNGQIRIPREFLLELLGKLESHGTEDDA